MKKIFSALALSTCVLGTTACMGNNNETTFELSSVDIDFSAIGTTTPTYDFDSQTVEFSSGDIVNSITVTMSDELEEMTTDVYLSAYAGTDTTGTLISEQYAVSTVSQNNKITFVPTSTAFRELTTGGTYTYVLDEDKITNTDGDKNDRVEVTITFNDTNEPTFERVDFNFTAVGSNPPSYNISNNTVSYSNGDKVDDLTVTFSENLSDISNNIYLSAYIGTDTSGSLISNEYASATVIEGNSITFTPTTEAYKEITSGGTYTYVMSAGSISDLSGNINEEIVLTITFEDVSIPTLENISFDFDPIGVEEPIYDSTSQTVTFTSGDKVELIKVTMNEWLSNIDGTVYLSAYEGSDKTGTLISSEYALATEVNGTEISFVPTLEAYKELTTGGTYTYVLQANSLSDLNGNPNEEMSLTITFNAY